MKITAIKQQERRAERYSVYIDEQFVCGFGGSDLVRLDLRVGDEVTSEQLLQLKADAEAGKAYDRALSYLERRPRSEYEMRQYLRRKEYNPEIIQVVIQKLFRFDLLDDAKFARDWIDWRQATTPRSKRKLSLELKQKGIAPEVIEELLEGIDNEDQLAVLKQLIERKGGRYNDRQKLMAYFARQGFSYDLIKQALND